MNRGYLKNLYLQQLEHEHYLAVFKESISRVVSLEIMNVVISRAVDDANNTVLNDLLELFVLRLRDDVVFHEKFNKSNFHLLLFKRPLTSHSYMKLRCIYDEIDTRRMVVNPEHTEFFRKHFYNYLLYKHTYNDYQYDIDVDMRDLGPAEVSLFRDLLKKICTRNRGNERLLEYVRNLPMDVDIFLSILDVEHKIEASKLGMEDAFLVYPTQVVGYVKELFYMPFLCSMNSENGFCKVCKKEVLEYESEKISLDDFLNDVVGSIEGLCHGISHWRDIRKPKTLTSLLKFLFQGSSSHVDYYKYLQYFSIGEGDEVEEIMVRLLRFVSSSLTIDKLKAALRMFPFVQHTSKTTFSYFVVLFEGFRKYSTTDLFVKDLIRNIVMRNKDKFMKIREMVFEYYLSVPDTLDRVSENKVDNTKLRSSVSDGVDLGKEFLLLSEFFDENPRTFVKNNMFYIYPLIYPLPHFSRYLSNPSFVQTNNRFLVVSLILKGEEDKISDMGYDPHELYVMGVDVIVPLFCNGYFRHDVLSRFFGDVREYISNNLSRLLFTLKTAHTDRSFEFKVCVFKVLRHVLEAASGDIKILFNYLFPFIEFFMGRHNRQCTMNCKNVFIEYYMSLLENKCFERNMSRIFPYLDVDKIIEWGGGNGNDRYLGCIESLLESRGYFSQDIALEKAVRLFKKMFDCEADVDVVGRDMESCKRRSKVGEDRSSDERIDEERFIRHLLQRFFRDVDFRLMIANIYKKFKKIGCDVLPLIGHISQEFLNTDPLSTNADIQTIECTTDSIARTMIKGYLLEIDPRKQDLYFFVIQETLKFVGSPLDEKIEGAVEQFRSTQYSYDHVPVYRRCGIYESTYRFKKFLEELYQYSLFQIQKNDMQSHFSLLKYGDLFDMQFLEFNCLCLVKLLVDGEHENEVLSVVENIVNDIHRGVDRRILEFILKLHRFTRNSYIDNLHVLRISLFLADHHTSIQTLETTIRSGRDRRLFDVLQYCYYSIKDHDGVAGINSVFMRPTSINLFFGFCADKDYTAARRCLESRKISECDDHPIHSTCTQNLGMKNTEFQNSVADDSDEPVISGLNLNSLLENVIEECEDDEVVRFMDECKKIECDFSEWKNLRSENEIFRHFLKDCELVSRSKDLLVTLDLIAGRRELSGNNKMLLECHRCLVRGIRSMMNDEEGLSNEEMIESLVSGKGRSGVAGEDFGIQACKRNYFDELASTSDDSVERPFERLDYSDGEGLATGRYGSLDEFERDLKLTIIRNHMKENELSICTREIGSMLLEKNWCVLYELAELNILQGKMGNAKLFLKKVLNLFPKTSVFYRNALVRHTELVDTKAAYQSALSCLNSSGRLFLLGAKKFEDAEPVKAMELYINSVINSNQYLNEAIPRIFHLFSEMSSANSVAAGSALLNRFLESNLHLLPPYYNQIISKLSHPNREIAQGVSKVVFKLMEHYPNETFWKSLATMNSQNIDTKKRIDSIVSNLSFDNKVFLSNIKKMVMRLTDIAKAKKKHLSMSTDFPELVATLPADVNIPNTKVAISGVREEIEIFSSLQCPKKICFIGADGKSYPWLCKHQDDLRKDARFMDLNIIINSIFKKQDSKKYIRTYTVIPFDHNSGIIEWINGLTSFKVICNSYYAKENISISNVSRRFVDRKRIGPKGWKDVVSKFPPRFHLWFTDNFPQSFNWFTARRNYITTYAVMNIVGWFMGLGDRHAENILFDSNTGDTVHVDLNCIFGKGRELEIPECVPYRLTQNIVDAFGVLGLEGPYNKSLFATLDLFLKNKNAIISNLLSFVHDPLFEWRKKTSVTPKGIIDGLYGKLDDVDVGSKGDMLNQEAMDPEHLCEMYIGWLPFI